MTNIINIPFPGVGKTSLVHRFIKGTFADSYTPTIEDTYKWVCGETTYLRIYISTRVRKVISSNNAVCTMQITDTAGSHQFPAMQRLSISKGHAFIMVFSISSRQSLEELKPILELINEVYTQSTYWYMKEDVAFQFCYCTVLLSTKYQSIDTWILFCILRKSISIAP